MSVSGARMNQSLWSEPLLLLEKAVHSNHYLMPVKKLLF